MKENNKKGWFPFGRKKEETPAPEDSAAKTPKEGQPESESTADIVESVFREAQEEAARKAAERAAKAEAARNQPKMAVQVEPEVMEDRDHWLLSFVAPMMALYGEYDLSYDVILKKDDAEKDQLKTRLESDLGISFTELTSVIHELLLPYAAEEDPVLQAVYKAPTAHWKDLFVSVDLCPEERAKELVDDVQFALQSMRSRNFAPPVGTLRAFYYAQAGMLALTGYGMGLIPKFDLMPLLNRISLLANWFYGSWDEYVSAFVFGRRVFMSITGRPWEKDDRDMAAISRLLRTPEGCYQRFPITFGITEQQRQAYSLKFRLIKDGDVAKDTGVTEEDIREAVSALEPGTGHFINLMPNMLMFESSQMVAARLPEAEREAAQENEAGEKPAFLVEIQFPKRKFVLACASLFTEEQAVSLLTDYCLKQQLPDISNWSSLTHTWEELIGADRDGDQLFDADTEPSETDEEPEQEQPQAQLDSADE